MSPHLHERSAGAGEYGGKCYRTACQRGGAVYFNHSTKRHYCRACATMINRVNGEDEFVKNLGHDLCTVVRPVKHDVMVPFVVTTTINGYRSDMLVADRTRVALLVRARDRTNAGEFVENKWPDDSIDLIETQEEYVFRTTDYKLADVRPF